MSRSLVRNANIARSTTTVGHSRHAGLGFRYAQPVGECLVEFAEQQCSFLEVTVFESLSHVPKDRREARPCFFFSAA
jgi:hypothetical protein